MRKSFKFIISCHTQKWDPEMTVTIACSELYKPLQNLRLGDCTNKMLKTGSTAKLCNGFLRYINSMNLTQNNQTT